MVLSIVAGLLGQCWAGVSAGLLKSGVPKYNCHYNDLENLFSVDATFTYLNTTHYKIVILADSNGVASFTYIARVAISVPTLH